MLPTVTIVFLVFNRRDELRESLERMTRESTYPSELVDVIVVDNASTDGSADMVREEFADVQLIVRTENTGVSAWNDGFAVARGEYVLALDDDAYLPGDGLERAVRAAREREADLVSFAVASTVDDSFRFDHRYRTGLLTFWGCAVLMRREILDDLRGYDPEIFVWANELELMVRFFDRGFRHLHLPEVVAKHMKPPSQGHWSEHLRHRAYVVNARHFAYIAAKLLRPRDALGAIVALLIGHLRDAVRNDRAALRALRPCVAGFVNGVRHRDPVASPIVSAAYRRNFHSFASPWWISRPPGELLRAGPDRVARALLGKEPPPPPPGRRDSYFSARRRFYPASAATLRFDGATATD